MTLDTCAKQLSAASVCSLEEGRATVAAECEKHAHCQQWLHAKIVEAAAVAMEEQRRLIMADLGDFRATHQVLLEHWHSLQANLQSCVGDVVVTLTAARGDVNQRRQEAEALLDTRIDALRQAGSKDQLATFKKIIKVGCGGPPGERDRGGEKRGGEGRQIRL